MIQIHCSTTAEIDAVWRLLCHVPAEDFIRCEIYLAQRPWGAVVRNASGDQTTAPVGDQQG
jgi:hypothetical protein